MTHMIVNGVKDGVECLLAVDNENKSVHGLSKTASLAGRRRAVSFREAHIRGWVHKATCS